MKTIRYILLFLLLAVMALPAWAQINISGHVEDDFGEL